MHSIADLIEQHREQVLQRYLVEARRLAFASGLGAQELLGHLPAYLDSVCALCRAPPGPRGWLRQTKRHLEDAHIQLRLGLGYVLEEVVAEFKLLGQLLSHLWESLPAEQRPRVEDLHFLLAEFQASQAHTGSVFRRCVREERRHNRCGPRRPDERRAGPAPLRVHPGTSHRASRLPGEPAHRREQQLRQAVEATGLGIWELNLLTDQFNGDVRFRSLFGLSADEPLRGTTLLALVHPEERERVLRLALEAQVPDGAGLFRCEFRLLGEPGQPERWMSATGRASFTPEGRLTRFIGTLLDISAQVEDRLSAQRDRDRVATILESLSEAFVAFDRDWRFTYVNREAERILARPRESLLGRSHWEAYPDAVGTDLERKYRRALEEQVRITFEVRSATSGRWFEFNLWPTDPGLVIYFQDITERHERQQERERLLEEQTRLRVRAEEALRESAHVAEFRERLIGIVSHDLRSPLYSITLAAEQLLRREDIPATALMGVRRIVRSTERMSRMIVDLLDFTRARVGGGIPLHLKSLELGELVRTTLEEIEVTAPGRVVFGRGPGPYLGAWDPDRLAQVVTNLVNNALHHGTDSTPVEVGLREEASELLLTVHNRGKPIPEELLPHVFDPFRRSSTGAHQGLGLGLYIVQQILLAHGGSIRVRSTQAEGTTFCVRLPRAPPSP